MHNTECVSIKLIRPTNRKAEWLQKTAGSFSRAVQLGLDYAEKADTSSRAKIHTNTYAAARFLGLPSEYARMSVNAAVSLVRSYYQFMKIQDATFPRVKKTQGIGLGTWAYKLIQDGDRFILRVSTGERGNYLYFPLCVPKLYRYRILATQGDAKLYKRGQDWYVSLPIRVPQTPTVCDGERTFIGVDLGIVKHATVAFPDRVVFFNGKPARQKRNHFVAVRKRYQAHKRMDRVRDQKGKESNWMKDLNHKISRRIVDLATLYPNPVIVLERLDGIRNRVKGSKKFNRMISSWAFRQLIDMIQYKSDREHIPVVFCDPRGTSKTCPKCGHSTRSNRPDQSHFRCVSCNYEANADLVGARNIAARGLYALVHGPLDKARPKGQTEHLQTDGAKINVQQLIDSNLVIS